MIPGKKKGRPGKTPPPLSGTESGPDGLPPSVIQPPGNLVLTGHTNASREGHPEWRRRKKVPRSHPWAAILPAVAARPERGCASASVGRPPAGRCPAGPGLPSRRGNLYRAPFRPRAALPRTAPGRRSPRWSASPVRRPVKTAPHKRPPSPPFPSILCGAGGEMRCKTVDRSADACYTVCDLKTIGAGKMRK